MERIVVADRTVVRVLALLPAAVVAVAVRLLTLGNPPLAVRVAAAAGIAVAAWVGYRLLTARLVVSETGVEVRGVFYEGEIPWTELQSADIATAARPIRALLWGVMHPHGLVLQGGSRALRPIAAVTHADDEDLRRALGAIHVRLGAWGVPAQRDPRESVASL